MILTGSNVTSRTLKYSKFGSFAKSWIVLKIKGQILPQEETERFCAEDTRLTQSLRMTRGRVTTILFRSHLNISKTRCNLFKRESTLRLQDQ